MTTTSIGRWLAVCIALVLVAAAVLVFQFTQRGREPAREARALPAPLMSSPPAANSKDAGAGAQDKGAPALAAAVDRAAAKVAELAAPPAAPAPDKSAIALDVIRIEPTTGEAVIAGRAGPGATVELSRNGERLDQTVADATGQFAMVPPRLPSGNYELTLSARSPDGTLATAKRNVEVAASDIVTTGTAAPRTADARAPAAAKPQDDAASRTPRAMAAVTPSDSGAPASAETPRLHSKVVARGDSLWRLSRLTYGDGSRYVIIYRANQGRIRNPDLIYPGQSLVVPARER